MLEETDKKGKRPGMVAVLNCEVLKTVYLKLKKPWGLCNDVILVRPCYDCQ